MNPSTTIRPWLLACGNQYGINEAFFLRWPDESTRPETMFFTYRLESTRRTNGSPAWSDMSSKAGHSATLKAIQAHTTVARIDLYNSQNGLYELASCCLALSHIESLQQLLCDHGVSLGDISEITDDTDYDADEIIYHQYAILEFNENVEFALTFDNEVVDEVLFNIIVNGGESVT